MTIWRLVRGSDSELGELFGQAVALRLEAGIGVFLVCVNDFGDSVVRVPYCGIIVKLSESVDVRFSE